MKNKLVDIKPTICRNPKKCTGTHFIKHHKAFKGGIPRQAYQCTSCGFVDSYPALFESYMAEQAKLAK